MTTKLSALVACLVLLAVSASAAQAKTFAPIGSDQFKLTSEGFGKGSYDRVRQLQTAYPRVGMTGLVKDLNRDTQPLLPGPVAGLKNVFGYSWESGDNEVDYWYPQGMTGRGGIQAVSWYRTDGNSDVATRISFVGRDKRHYRFALLAEPAGGTRFNQVAIHAGGIAWAGKYMYVADTNTGFRVFDASRILRVPNSRLGATGNYRYLLPQVGRYRTVGAAFTYSAASLDTSIPGKPALVAGEYCVMGSSTEPCTNNTTRIARWQVDPKTKRLARGQAIQAYATTFDQLQGVTIHKGRIFVSSSQGDTGRLYYAKPGTRAKNKAWGNTPQALYVSEGALWSHTEVLNNRTVFAKRLGDL